MPRNRVQHQKGLSDDAFERLYPDEEACRRAWFAWRWPWGFKCPRCAASEYSSIRDRRYKLGAAHRDLGSGKAPQHRCQRRGARANRVAAARSRGRYRAASRCGRPRIRMAMIPRRRDFI
ncbi:MAG: transposase [Stellaceae bacterium]